MIVYVICESSGVVREAFTRQGHDVYSCDLKEAEDNSPRHFKGDAFDFLANMPPPDLVIAHPPCTYLCNSGVRWLYKDGKKDNGRDGSRWRGMHDAAAFFLKLWHLAIERNPDVKLAFENPVPHGYALQAIGQASQYVQPWWFGDKAFKATGLWLRGLSPLVKTSNLVPPASKTAEHKAWSVIHMASPGPNRAEDRSRTFQGFANAMAQQWG